MGNWDSRTCKNVYQPPQTCSSEDRMQIFAEKLKHETLKGAVENILPLQQKQSLASFLQIYRRFLSGGLAPLRDMLLM